jgi:hypothetical protein
LERVTDYTFEARAISACGAKSSWATQTFNLPDVDPGTLTLTDINNTANANASLVQNPFFNTGDLTGWTSTSGTYAYEKGTNGPLPGTTGYAKRVGNGTTPSDVLRNLGRIPVVQGSVVKVAASIRGIGANGTAGVRISWRGSNDAELGVASNDSTLTGTFNYGATIVGTAPANACWAYAEGSVKSHTSGTYTFDTFMASGGVDNLDQMPDGGTYSKVKGGNLTGGNIDLASTVIANKNLDYIPDGSIRIGSIQYTDGETVDNANFEASASLPVPGWTASPGAALSYTTTANAYAGNRSLQLISGGTAGRATTTRQYKCRPGDVWLLQAQCAGSSFAQTFGCLIFTNSNTGASSTQIAFTLATGDNTYALRGGQVQVPSGMDTFVIAFVCNNATYGMRIDDVALGKVRTTDGLAPLSWASVRSAITSSPISYSISGTTVTFSVAACTFASGSHPISYSAASASVTQTAGTTVGYYLYFRDPIRAGGAQTLHIATRLSDLAAYDDIVQLGTASVTVNSGGGGTGGTGGGGGGILQPPAGGVIP